MIDATSWKFAPHFLTTITVLEDKHISIRHSRRNGHSVSPSSVPLRQNEPPSRESFAKIEESSSLYELLLKLERDFVVLHRTNTSWASATHFPISKDGRRVPSSRLYYVIKQRHPPPPVGLSWPRFFILPSVRPLVCRSVPVSLGPSFPAHVTRKG